MNMSNIKSICLRSLLAMCLLLPAYVAPAQSAGPKDEIIKAMDNAALEWNKGNLDGYMVLYDSTATMMTKDGRIGIIDMRALYIKYFFVGNTPKQELFYDNYQLSLLGSDHALLTGRFTLKATASLPQRTGAFSLVLVHTANGWKILHDHSG